MYSWPGVAPACTRASERPGRMVGKRRVDRAALVSSTRRTDLLQTVVAGGGTGSGGRRTLRARAGSCRWCRPRSSPGWPWVVRGRNLEGSCGSPSSSKEAREEEFRKPHGPTVRPPAAQWSSFYVSASSSTPARAWTFGARQQPKGSEPERRNRLLRASPR